jgi:hypothetical protein
VLGIESKEDGNTAATVVMEQPKEEEEEHYWGQALQYLDRAVSVEPDRKGKFLFSLEKLTNS